MGGGIEDHYIADIPISEIFHSFSGEAPTVGRYSTFIRFAGCNMKSVGGSFCKWCDTPYAIKGEEIKKDPNFKFMTPMEVVEEMIDVGTNLVVFTGGEPALYLEQINSINHEIGHRSFELNLEREVELQIETNGSIQFSLFFLSLFNYIVVSPKFPPGIEKPYDLRFFESPWKSSPYELAVKFVYEGEESEKYICDTVEKYHIDPSQVWIMPQGTCAECLRVRARNKVFDFCVTNRFNFSTRMQIIYFGNKRGV